MSAWRRCRSPSIVRISSRTAPRWRTCPTASACAGAFSHLVLSDRVLDQVGTALAAGHSMFVYGPPGNGKTVIAQACGKLLDGEIAIPHAIEMDGHLMRLFDPVNHEPLSATADTGLVSGPRLDARWVRCRRPLVTVGGELTLDSLESVVFPGSRVLHAADPGAGQWRRAGHRRLRTPAAARRASCSTAGSSRSRAAWTTSRSAPARSSRCRSWCS